MLEHTQSIGYLQQSSNCTGIWDGGSPRSSHRGCRARVLLPPASTPASELRSVLRRDPPEDTVDVVLQGRRHAAGPGGSGNQTEARNKETSDGPPDTSTGSRRLANSNTARLTRPQRWRISDSTKQEAGRCGLVRVRSMFPLGFRVATGKGR